MEMMDLSVDLVSLGSVAMVTWRRCFQGQQPAEEGIQQQGEEQAQQPHHSHDGNVMAGHADGGASLAEDVDNVTNTFTGLEDVLPSYIVVGKITHRKGGHRVK